MLTGPGNYLIAMTWWILAFFLVALFSYPFWTYRSSFLVFFIPLVFALVGGVALNILESRFGLWSHSGFWGKFPILATAYTVVIGTSLVTTAVLDSYRLVAYFGGDAGGSFGLLYILSVVLYWLVGAAVCAFARL